VLAMLVAALLSPVDIPRVAGDLVSARSKAWEGAGLPIVAMVGTRPQVRPFGEFGVTAKLGWNEEGLAAQVEVTEPKIHPSPDPARPYEGDSVEIYLGIPGHQNMVQFIVYPGGKKLYDYRTKELQQAGPMAGRSSWSTTPTGYIVRGLVSWKSLGIEPKLGTVVGARVAVNAALPGRGRESYRWQNGDFFGLPEVKLSDSPGAAPTLATWATTSDDLTSYLVNVIGEASDAGKSVRYGAQEAKLTADGPRSVAQIRVRVAPGAQPEALNLEVDGRQIGPVAMPDMRSVRRQAFARGEGPFKRSFPNPVFQGQKFPDVGLADKAAAEAIVGPIDIKTEYYDARRDQVEWPEKAGRYGAVVHVQSKLAGSATLYQTLFEGNGSGSAIVEAAKSEGVLDSVKADEDWWHSLRRKLGTAIHYDSYLRFPDDSPGKKWPLIVALHGSGGGNPATWDTAKLQGGPMGYAIAHPGFPFAVLVPRSPGGWYPPAVNEAIDEAVATGRIDTNRIVLCGFSMGAIGTWSVAYDAPNRFAALAIVGGRSGDSNRMKFIKDVPVWVFNGAEDETTLPTEAKAAVASLKAAGGHVRFTLLLGAGHVDSLNLAYAMPDLYAWMADQKLHPTN
jgi:predicted esterase